MPLDNEQLQTLKDEFDNDPEGNDWDLLSVEDVATNMNEQRAVSNPTPNINIDAYNITGTSASKIEIGDILDKIGVTQLVALRNDSGDKGKVIYDRLMALENRNAIVDVKLPRVIGLVTLLKSNNLITEATKESIIGTSSIPDPTYSAIINTSRREELSLPMIEGNDVINAKNL